MKKFFLLITIFFCFVFTSSSFTQEKDTDEARIELLIEKLADDDWEVRDEARAQLIELKSKAIPYLKKAKETTTNYELKIRIEEILKDIGEETTPENISERVQQLIDILAKEDFVFLYDWSYKDEPTCYIYRLGGYEKVLEYEESIEYLKDYTKSNNVFLRRNLAYLFHLTKSKKVAPYLKEMLKDPDENVIVFALYSLIKLDDNSYQKELSSLLQSQNKHIKKMAIKAVEKNPTKEFIEMLIPLLEDSNKDVRFNAFYSFYKITDVSFNYNAYSSEKKRTTAVQKIKNWWGENKNKIEFKKKDK